MGSKFELKDLEAERNVLGSIMSYKKALDDVREIITSGCFTSDFHNDIYNSALAIAEKGDDVDIISVVDELRRLGKFTDTTAFDVSSLLSAASANYYYSAQVISEFHVRRSVWKIAHKLLTKSTDMIFDVGETIEECVKALSDVFSSPTNSISTMRETAIELYEQYINKNLSGGTELTGSPTGFEAFDSKSGGLQQGDLIITAGETSQGKTSFVTAMIMNAAKSGCPIAFYSMEMTRTQLFARMAATETGIPANKYLYGQLSRTELEIFDSNVTALVNLPIYFDDKSTSNIDVILSSIRVMVAKKRIKGVVVDYLQILNVNMKGSNKEQQMGEVARRLKNLAKDLNIWIIALSQLSRDHSNPVPNLNRIRESGQIAEAADTVMFVYRPEVYNLNYPEPFKSASTNGTAMIDIAKGRNIGLIKFLVGFDSPTTRFYDLKNEIPVPEDDNPF